MTKKHRSKPRGPAKSRGAAKGPRRPISPPTPPTPTVGDIDLHLFAEGTHQQLWRCLGARPRELDGVAGFAFSVWAPNAREVSLVGDFCGWDGGRHPMRRLGPSGVFDLFVPGLRAGEAYKYQIVAADGTTRLKADPLARWAEASPNTASRTYRSSYRWQDAEWMEAHATSGGAMVDVTRQPMAIYEVHLGSWKSAHDLDPESDPAATQLGYREIA